MPRKSDVAEPIDRFCELLITLPYVDMMALAKSLADAIPAETPPLLVADALVDFAETHLESGEVD